MPITCAVDILILWEQPEFCDCEGCSSTSKLLRIRSTRNTKCGDHMHAKGSVLRDIHIQSRKRCCLPKLGSHKRLGQDVRHVRHSCDMLRGKATKTNSLLDPKLAQLDVLKATCALFSRSSRPLP